MTGYWWCWPMAFPAQPCHECGRTLELADAIVVEHPGTRYLRHKECPDDETKPTETKDTIGAGRSARTTGS